MTVRSALGKLGDGRYMVTARPEDRLVVSGTGHVELLHAPGVVREVAARLA